MIVLSQRGGKLLKVMIMTVMRSPREIRCQSLDIQVGEEGVGAEERGRGRRTIVDQEMTSHANLEDDSDMLEQNDKHTQSNESPENMSKPEEAAPSSPVSKPAKVVIRNFDLNMNPDEDMDLLSTPTLVPTSLSPKSISEEKQEEYPGWSLFDVEKMAIDPIQLANLNTRIDDDVEDYDEV
uniref:Uncharacterized protein n=1 Tax=Lotus japonicus TaxID=34305 RepID=I3S6V8_LOTJA|nr:unknown [Lotus japonicus]